MNFHLYIYIYICVYVVYVYNIVLLGRVYACLPFLDYGPSHNFMNSKYNFANLGRPHNPIGMQPHEPKSMCVGTCTTSKYYI